MFQIELIKVKISDISYYETSVKTWALQTPGHYI